jgi:hypothetical protein
MVDVIEQMDGLVIYRTPMLQPGAEVCMTARPQKAFRGVRVIYRGPLHHALGRAQVPMLALQDIKVGRQSQFAGKPNPIIEANLSQPPLDLASVDVDLTLIIKNEGTFPASASYSVDDGSRTREHVLFVLNPQPAGA